MLRICSCQLCDGPTQDYCTDVAIGWLRICVVAVVVHEKTDLSRLGPFPRRALLRRRHRICDGRRPRRLQKPWIFVDFGVEPEEPAGRHFKSAALFSLWVPFADRGQEIGKFGEITLSRFVKTLALTPNNKNFAGDPCRFALDCMKYSSHIVIL